MWRSLLFLCFGLLPGLALAQSPMSASEFERETTGKTLTFSANGMPYGAEEYREDREVRWSFLDGECSTGTWYPQDGAICFVYEDEAGNESAPQCWHFFREGGGLRAEFVSETPGTTLYETETSDEPLLCYGPRIGV
ncbi:hypothetical protein [Palleronia abyssalis]|uniref:Uncharacterized protein n=1 Tax=Palleronia abyssalis TaxID=1501240 RepID=A0A2R8BXD3_9RHOB|nr:hypothetical protein [Palleronia abyssalis]SPJ24821.1 hypothetical protein PAA8504_02660 [Palleronia abyssalis]